MEITRLDVRPWGYQREILDELAAEREHPRPVAQPRGDGDRDRQDGGRRRSTTKRLRESRAGGRRCSSSRTGDEILRQSRSTFRHVLRRRRLRRAARRRGTSPRVAPRLRVRSVLDSARPSRARPRALRHGDRRRVPPRRRRDVPPPARPPAAQGAARPDRDPGADGRRGRPGVVRRPHRRRVAAVGGAGTAAARSVPVLRPARRRRPLDRSAGSAAGYDTADLDNVYTGNDAPRARSILQALHDNVAEPGPHARAGVLRQHRPRRVHGPALQRTRASQRGRSPPRR